MATNKISPKYIGSPVRIPVLATCVIWLMLDRLHASEVVSAVIWTVWAILSLAAMAAPFQENWMHPRHLPNDDESASKR